MQYRKRLNSKEKRVIHGVVEGRIDPNAKSIEEILNRPHVAVALEVLFEQKGLSDEQLISRLKEIIDRKPVESISKTGAVSTNITAIDSNALATIRTIWQVKGKFTEKVEHSGHLSNLSDEQLDAIISSGSEYIHLRKNKLTHSGTQSDRDGTSSPGK